MFAHFRNLQDFLSCLRTFTTTDLSIRVFRPVDTRVFEMFCSRYCVPKSKRCNWCTKVSSLGKSPTNPLSGKFLLFKLSKMHFPTLFRWGKVFNCPWPADSCSIYKTRDIPNKVCMAIYNTQSNLKLYISNLFDSFSAVKAYELRVSN